MSSAIRTDTIVGLSVSRPAPPTTELLIPLKPPVGVATYTVRRPFWTKAPARRAGYAWGGALACLVPFSYAVAQILGGAR